MASRRQRQVAELLHKEISQLIQYRTRDPRLGFVTITGVDVSPDLSQARVYVSVLGNAAEAREALQGLAAATGYFRRELGHMLSLRHIPKLAFELDTSLEYGMRIDHLLDSLKDEAAEPPAAENSSEVEPNT